MNKKTILITGCSSGIGLDAAQTLRQRGYQVIASARTTSQVSDLQSQGFEAVLINLDDEASIDSGFAQTLKLTRGKLDFLFNNGAYGQPGAVEDLSTEVLRQQFQTNVFGWHYLTCKAISQMRTQGHGRIVQNSSVLGFICLPYRGAYNASKYALEGLTDTLRLELKGLNIHLSLIEPGPIVSNFRKNALAKFKQNINWQQSHHREAYQIQIERLEKEGVAAPFTLPAAAVTQCLIHALESNRPKTRYRVTFPSKLFGFLKRILPSRWLDQVLAKS